jgi:hypothetical protein
VTANQQPLDEIDPFYRAFRGGFSSMLRWHELDALWAVLRQQADAGWYIYAIGEALPEAPADADAVEKFITEMDRLLREEHEEDYCGIVYADDREDPSFIKIYDPHNLGVVCGSSTNPPLPGWVLSKLPPRALEQGIPKPMNRRRWWQRLWS